MPEYTVYLTQIAETMVKVNAESIDDAIDLAHYQAPSSSLCVHCSGSGYGNDSPGIELAGQWDAAEVTNSEGDTVWTDKGGEVVTEVVDSSGDTVWTDKGGEVTDGE